VTTQIALNYSRKTIRALVSSEGIWWAAADIYAAHNRRTERGDLARMSPDHLRLCTFATDAGPVVLTCVSLEGVAAIALGLPSPTDRILHGWARKQAAVLTGQHGFPPPALCLTADGRLPVRPPYKQAEAYEAWKKLAAQHPDAKRRPANPYEPSLYDQDPSLPPHDPEAGVSAITAMLTEGQRLMDLRDAERSAAGLPPLFPQD